MTIFIIDYYYYYYCNIRLHGNILLSLANSPKPMILSLLQFNTKKIQKEFKQKILTTEKLEQSSNHQIVSAQAPCTVSGRFVRHSAIQYYTLQ